MLHIAMNISSWNYIQTTLVRHEMTCVNDWSKLFLHNFISSVLQEFINMVLAQHEFYYVFKIFTAVYKCNNLQPLLLINSANSTSEIKLFYQQTKACSTQYLMSHTAINPETHFLTHEHFHESMQFVSSHIVHGWLGWPILGSVFLRPHRTQSN